MRPIDADVLIPLIQEDKIEGETLNIVKALGEGLQAETLNQTCDRHIKIIRGLPTIDTVKHARWISNTGGFSCSNCKHQTDDDEIGNWDITFGKWVYCPHCGARMDG